MKQSHFAALLAIALVFIIVPPLFREPAATLLTALTIVATVGFGCRVCRWIGVEFESRSAEVAIAAGIGFGAWILGLMLLAMFAELRALPSAAILILMLAVGARSLPRFRGVVVERSALAVVSVTALVAMILMLQFVVLTPSVLYDALATHLAASRNLSLHHALPAGDYGFLPQGFELMMGAADSLAGPFNGGQGAEQMIAPIFLALTWVALFAIAREFGGRRDVALAAATLAIAIPVVQWNGASAKNDVPMAFLLLVALLAGLRAISTREPQWIFLGAFAAAAAANIKHTAFLGIAPLAILFLFAAWRTPHRLRTVLIAIVVFAACGTFWMVRATYTHHDPVFPLRSPGMMERPASEISLADRAMYLVKLQFGGTSMFEGNSTTRLGLFFLLFLPAIFLLRRRDFDARVLACCFFAAIYLLIWFSTWPVLRYAVAPVVLVALGLAATAARAPVFLIAFAICQIWNLWTMTGMTVNRQRLAYIARTMDRDSYLRQTLPSYGALAWLRDHAPAKSPILAIGTHALAYAPDPALVDSPFNEQGPFPSDRIAAAIESKRYRYAIVSRDGSPAFASETAAFADDHFVVYQLP